MKKKYLFCSIFQGLFKKRVFRSIALVIKKLWAILDFYRPVLYSMDKTKQKMYTKNPSNFY